RNIILDHCTRTGIGAITHGHRSDEHGVGTGAHMGADGGVVLVHTVIVDEHGGGPDVGVLTDGGIADVGQVGDLGATADGGLLGFHETTELALRAELGARTDVGEGADGGVLADLGIGPVGADDGCSGADDHVGQGGVGTDLRAVTDGGGAPKLGARVDEHVTADGDLHIDPGGGRVDDGGTPAHGGLHGATVEFSAGLGELVPVIDTGEFARIGGDVSADRVALAAGDAEDIGEVELALRVVGLQLGEGGPQDGRVEGEHTGVDLGDGALLIGGVLLLDNRGDLTVGVADDAAVTGG